MTAGPNRTPTVRTRADETAKAGAGDDAGRIFASTFPHSASRRDEIAVISVFVFMGNEMRKRSSQRRRWGGAASRGFSLVEVLFAVLLLVVAAGGLVRAVAQASQARRAAADTGLATRVARAKLEELLAAPFSRGWPWSGYHPALTPGGSAEPGKAPVPGYFEYFSEEAAASDRDSALYEVRWRIRELVPPGPRRLATLGLEVVAVPAGGGRGPVVRLESVRVANRE